MIPTYRYKVSIFKSKINNFIVEFRESNINHFQVNTLKNSAACSKIREPSLIFSPEFQLTYHPNVLIWFCLRYLVP